MNDWLSNLRAGDEVVVNEYKEYSLHAIQCCDESTLQVNGRRYNRKDGVLVGRVKHKDQECILEPTFALRNAIYRAQIFKKLNGVDWTKYPTARLEAVLELLEAK